MRIVGSGSLSFILLFVPHVFQRRKGGTVLATSRNACKDLANFSGGFLIVDLGKGVDALECRMVRHCDVSEIFANDVELY